MNSMKHLSSVICQHASKRLTCACVLLLLHKADVPISQLQELLVYRPLVLLLGYNVRGFHKTRHIPFVVFQVARYGITIMSTSFSTRHLQNFLLLFSLLLPAWLPAQSAVGTPLSQAPAVPW